SGRESGATGPCPNANGTSDTANSSTPVQLIPFNDTPNNGDEYKVWLTPTGSYSLTSCGTVGHGGKDAFGFCDSHSKTDNFKIRANASRITVCKFNDLNNDGVRDGDPLDPLIKHWPITATGVDNSPNTAQTNDNGCVTFVNSSGTDSNVTLTEGTSGFGWTQTAPADGTDGVFTATNGVISVTLHPGDNVNAPYFGNFNPYCTNGCPVDHLTVTKTAQPRLTRTYTWTITKSVLQTTVDTASGTGATFNYTVNVTHDQGTDSGWSVTGSIRVSNGGAVAINNVDVTDAVDNGGVCTVTGGTGVTIPANNHLDLDYTCTYASLPAAGTNTASASFGVSTGTAAVNFGSAEVTVV